MVHTQVITAAIVFLLLLICCSCYCWCCHGLMLYLKKMRWNEVEVGLVRIERPLFFFFSSWDSVKKKCNVEKQDLCLKDFLWCYSINIFFKQSFWPLSQPPVDYECLLMSGWWHLKTKDLLNVSRVYQGQHLSCGTTTYNALEFLHMIKQILLETYLWKCWT